MRGARRGSPGRRGGGELYPDPIGGEVWSGQGRAAYELAGLREGRLFFFFSFFFRTGVRGFNKAGNDYIKIRGNEDFYLFLKLLFPFSSTKRFRGAVPWCALSSAHTYQTKKISMHVRTCIRRPDSFPGWSIELLAFANRLFAPTV